VIVVGGLSRDAIELEIGIEGRPSPGNAGAGEQQDQPQLGRKPPLASHEITEH
jgi:hypothetical protein